RRSASYFFVLRFRTRVIASSPALSPSRALPLRMRRRRPGGIAGVLVSGLYRSPDTATDRAECPAPSTAHSRTVVRDRSPRGRRWRGRSPADASGRERGFPAARATPSDERPLEQNGTRADFAAADVNQAPRV